tara:strand:- start:42 stop:989 length:948 start_codon:yes stop_codon:yes gene_type:complete
MRFDVPKNTVFECLTGSRAYGTNIEGSDVDFKGVCVPPKDVILDPFFSFDQHEEQVNRGHDHDRTIFALQKFLKLASECNPNIVELLYTEESDWTVCAPVGRVLIEKRDIFLSKRAKFRFMGYAHSQLKKMRGHYEWLRNPPKSKPLRSDFGLPESGSKVIDKTTMGAIEDLESQGYTFGPEVATAVRREKEYASALTRWKQYQGWKKNRNEARAKLESKFGYDTKNGMHLIRLMRMCAEIMEGKGVITKRPDAEELIEIRLGSKTYEEIMEEASRLEDLVEDLYKKSSLPDETNTEEIKNLCVALHEAHWSLHG